MARVFTRQHQSDLPGGCVVREDTNPGLKHTLSPLAWCLALNTKATALFVRICSYLYSQPATRSTLYVMTPNSLTWADFEKVDIRTGTILSVEPFPKARKPAYKLTIDFGALGIRRSSAQITTLYEPETLLGKQVVAVVNFPLKQIATFMSECLVLGAVADDGTVTLLQTERPTENGQRIG